MTPRTTAKTPSLWNFHALAGRPDAPEVLRVPVTAALQRDLSAEFAKQLTAFDLDGSELVEYEASYKPDPGELLVVRGFALPATFPELATVPDLPPLSAAHIESGAVRALIGVPQGTPAKGKVICFQGVDSRQLIRKSRFSIFMSREVFARNEQAGLVVRDALTAVLRGFDLFFPSEAPVRRFLDLSSVFEEATDPQITSFLHQPGLFVENAAAIAGAADDWTRRKITAIAARKIMRDVTPEAVARVGKEFGLHVATTTVNGKRALVVPTATRELKDFLRLLDQDYLSSTLTPDRFRVNSKKRL